MRYKEKIKSSILDMEEHSVNAIVSNIGMISTIGANFVVAGLLGGTLIDWLILFLPLGIALVKLLEKNVSRFQKYAKYAYLTVPMWCSIILGIINDGRYAAATQFYFMFLMLSVAYYDVKMVLWCAGTTIFGVLFCFCMFPEAMLGLDKPGVWLYILFIYSMTIIVALIIAKRTRYFLEETRRMHMYEDELVYLEQLQKKDEIQSEVIHNINHYFIAIAELARIENSEQIVQLVEELNGKLRKSERIIYSKHKVLNAILAEKVSEAKEQNIKCEFNVEPVLKLQGITDGDLVSMLGNLLDNALEATTQCEGEKRKIYLWIYMENEGNVCVVKMVNYFVNPRIYGKTGFITTKKNKAMHGIGIRSVEYTAKKYGGYLQCMAENEKFTTILVLPNRK